ncbi:MAG: DUF6097 family protein [Corticimicrobacter sp.]|uniref:DUF6097 family protein n=1 Tax=Corticimicrobacter sp. TaxID=2678536 RepID=UPI0032DB85BD
MNSGGCSKIRPPSPSGEMGVFTDREALNMLGSSKNAGAAVDEAQILKELHQRIEQQSLPVAVRDEMEAQLVDLDSYMGTSALTGLQARTNRANIWGGVMASPFLIYMLFLVFNRFTDKLGLHLGGTALLNRFNAFLLDSWWLLVLWLVVMGGLFLYYYGLKRKTEQARKMLIDAFYARTSSFGGV